MAEIHIHRDHQLGLTKARKVAWDWAELAEQKFDMDCTVAEGSTSDTVSFERSGVKGELTVAADHFELRAKLGFLLGAFAKTIERQIEDNLDSLLGAAKAAAETASQPAAGPAAQTTAKAAPPKKAASKKSAT